jgi:hypothetical protein
VSPIWAALLDRTFSSPQGVSTRLSWKSLPYPTKVMSVKTPSVISRAALENSPLRKALDWVDFEVDVNHAIEVGRPFDVPPNQRGDALWAKPADEESQFEDYVLAGARPRGGFARFGAIVVRCHQHDRKADVG